GVSDAWDRLVVSLAWFAEDVRGGYLALILADVCQLPDACDVADRPQPLARTHLRVDWDAARVRGDADGLEPDSLDARAPSGRHQQMIAAQVPPILESQDEVLPIAGGRDRLHTERELDSVAPQRVTQRLAQGLRLPGEHALATLDKRHCTAQTPHHLGEFDAGRATSEHH